jgi:hypothetical protein
MNGKRFKALDEAIARLSRLLSSGGSELVHDRRLREALRELKAYRKGGKQPPRRLYLAVQLICQVICEEVLKKSAKEAR